MFQHYLSPAGSIDRRTFVGSTARVVAASLALGVPLFFGFKAASQANHMPGMFASGLALMVVLLASGWSCLALQIQRLHHQGYTARSAIVMTIAGFALAPVLQGMGLSEGLGSALGTALALGYVAWLVVHRGPAESAVAAATLPPGDGTPAVPDRPLPAGHPAS